MRKIHLSIITSCIACILCSCMNMPVLKKTETNEQNQSIKIGFCIESYLIERWQRERDIFVSTANELGAEVNVQNANGSIEEQIKQIEYLTKQGVDVIVIVPLDSKALCEAVKKAQKEGIKVIAYDRLIQNANVDLYISVDSQSVGKLMAESLVKTVPKGGNILMVGGPLADYNVLLMEQSFLETMGGKSLHILDRAHLEEWIPDQAFSVMKEALKTYPNIDGIMCGNDAIASQVIRALAEERMAGKVQVVGQDADVEACQRIVEGTQSMTVYKPIDTLAKKSAEYAVMLAQNQTLQIDKTLDDGTYNVPFVGLEAVAVTKENMNEVIIDSGFHMKEEVYINIIE